MDEEAIIHADDLVLRKNGLVCDGDIIRLRVFCRQDDSTERKAQLKDAIVTGRESRQSSSPSKSNMRQNSKHKTIYISWEHFDKKKDRYALVKSEKGGGSKRIKFSVTATKKDVLDVCITHFWSCRKENEFLDSHFMLADFRHDVLPDVFPNSLDPFTVGAYCEYHKLTRPRIYFQTKPKTTMERIVESLNTQSNPDDVDDDNNDDDFDIPAFAYSPISATPQSTSQLPVPFLDLTEDNEEVKPNEIIERRQLVSDQNKEYDQSLRADRQKDLEIEQKETENTRLEEVRLARLARLEHEATLEEEHVVVAVRHTELKLQTRFFRSTSTMTAVYDWIGSLSREPEHFQLYNCNRLPAVPDDKVLSGVYDMQILDSPLLMSPSGTVAFKGFGVIEEEPYKDLMNLRKEAFNKLKDGSITGIVNRDNIFHFLLEFYSTTDADEYKEICLTFENENAVGDGVAKDAFSQLFDHIAQTWEGCNALVPSLTLDQQQLVLLGKIITHAFLLFEMFPVNISKVSLKQIFFGKVGEEELLESFYNHLPERETYLIKSFVANSRTQPIMDILSEFRIFNKPTSENILQLCKKAAHIALIQSPYFQFESFGKQVYFFKSLKPESFDSLYSNHIPTCDAVIASFESMEASNQEQKIITWLHRYLRSCDNNGIAIFLRFVTTKSSLSPTTKIEIVFVNQPPEYVRPMSETCFCILHLSRQYMSFSHFCANMNKWMHNDSSSGWSLHDN